MGSVNQAESNDMYSWWWASHISPKHSKWLQENLTDMDNKVKQMIKIIEVDEDSFARRAEMYYEKRPELMKLVEEFYRAYRSLAERYDHATDVIRHAHKTMAEAFPNQVPFIESDDASCEPVALTPSAPFAKLSEGKVGKALNFHEKDQELSQSERLERSENDIKALKDALAKIEAEKEEELAHYQESMKRLSSLESEVLRAQQDSRGFQKRASKAETEVHSLKECLAKLEGEREACLSQYQQYLDRIFSLESCVSCSQEGAVCFERQPHEAEEAEVLKAEKTSSLTKYLEALERIANLEKKLMLAEDEVKLARERADNAEKEVATFKEALARITEEKEAAALQYQECLEKIASLENKIAKLKGAEEQCLLLERSSKSMKSEIETALLRLGIQNEELSENQKELGRLRKCIQEERMRFDEAETAFRTLQILHSQTQEELRSVSTELQIRVQLLKDMEVQNQNLEDEVQQIRDESKSLHEISTNSAISLENMQGEIISLKEGKEKLEGQRNALQQEIYHLKDLQEENSKLKDMCQSSEAEISVLLEKLVMMEKVTEKNVTLEYSLSLLSAELDDARGKVKALEESCRLLMDEKSLVLVEKTTVMSQLSVTTENLEKLSKRNTFLVNTLFDLNAELEALRTRYGNLEDSCLILNDEKSILSNERQILDLKLEQERVSKLELVEELHKSLAAEKQNHERSTQLSQMQLAVTESKICTLEGQLGEESDKAANAQFEIFILRNALQDLGDANCSLLKNCKKFLEKSSSTEKLISKMEDENTQYVQAVAAISDAVASLERHFIDTEVDNGNDQVEVHKIVLRINAVENKVKEINMIAEERSLRALKPPSIRSQPGISRSRSRRFSSEVVEKITKQLNQNCKTEEAVHELAMKDIMLDQASRTSSRRMNRKVTPYNDSESDDSQMPAEKELRVDSLELSKRSTETNEPASNKKVLERLASDIQKLTSLQITVQDLKQKVQITGSSKQAKSKEDTDYTDIKAKLDESERAILKLLEANNNLVKNVQDCVVESPLWPSSSLFVTEQAKKCSNKIGRLQAETQKMQFLLLKLDASNKCGTRFVERDREVLLQDYLYGRGARASGRRSEAWFCACVQPPTSGD